MTDEQDQARQDALADLKLGYASEPATRDKGITWTRDGGGHDTVEAPVVDGTPEAPDRGLETGLRDALVGQGPPPPAVAEVEVEVDEREVAMANLRAGYAQTDEAA